MMYDPARGLSDRPPGGSLCTNCVRARLTYMGSGEHVSERLVSMTMTMTMITVIPRVTPLIIWVDPAMDNTVLVASLSARRDETRQRTEGRLLDNDCRKWTL
jgi:hypothetical protein